MSGIRYSATRSSAPSSVPSSSTQAGPLKVGAVVIDCNAFETMYTFWREALRYDMGEIQDGDFVILRDPNGVGVNVSIAQVPERRVGKNRLHLDLYADDQQGEVARLLGLGAKRHERIPEEGEDFVVLEDPEGNLFCVIDTSGY